MNNRNKKREYQKYLCSKTDPQQRVPSRKRQTKFGTKENSDQNY